MLVNLRMKLAAGTFGVLALGGIGATAAYAQSTPAPSITAPNHKAETPAKAEGAGTEKVGAPEAGDAGLPGGGHADPAGSNVNHQFNGAE